MPRRKPSTSQLAIVDRNGEADERPVAKRPLDFGERWSYAPAPEASNYIKLRDRYQLFINGRFVEPKSGDYFDSINPATEKKLAEIGSANEKDIDLAVKAARRAYKNVWSKMPRRERGKYLFRIARLIQEKARELAVLETMDGGKTIKESRDIDLPLVAAHFFSLRRLGRQIGIRFSRSQSAAARRRRSNHSVEFSVADGGVEAGSGPCLRKHLCPEAGRDHFHHRSSSRPNFAGSGITRWRG